MDNMKYRVTKKKGIKKEEKEDRKNREFVSVDCYLDI